MHHGLRLREGSADYIEFIIQDDLTGLDIFNVIASGKRVINKK